MKIKNILILVALILKSTFSVENINNEAENINSSEVIIEKIYNFIDIMNKLPENKQKVERDGKIVFILWPKDACYLIKEIQSAKEDLLLAAFKDLLNDPCHKGRNINKLEIFNINTDSNHENIEFYRNVYATLQKAKAIKNNNNLIYK